MKTKKLGLIDKPDPKKHRVMQSDTPGQTKVFVTEGEPDVRALCGKCDAILADLYTQYRFEGLVILCDACGSYNLLE